MLLSNIRDSFNKYKEFLMNKEIRTRITKPKTITNREPIKYKSVYWMDKLETFAKLETVTQMSN